RRLAGRQTRRPLPDARRALREKGTKGVRVPDFIGGGSGDHKGRPYAIRKDSSLLVGRPLLE
ncbi:hypothetical protein MUO65_05290, partial [bacterium]|nr:hypothetical protein [bacterium]